MHSQLNISPEILRCYRTDQEPNFFSELRRRQNISYPEQPGQTETLFWPGCALSSYAPDLTEAVFRWLLQRGLAEAMTPQCCGTILRFSAPPEQQQRFAERLKASFTEQGLRRLIAACPNCFYCLRALVGEALEVRLLSDLLREEGMRLTPALLGAQSVAIHDSCPDRREGIIATSVRALCSELEIRELAHHCRQSRCCGAGQLLFFSDPKRSAELRAERLREVVATKAEVLLCSCVSCAQTFNSAADGASGSSVRVLHYLEPLFNQPINWSALAQMLQRASR